MEPIDLPLVIDGNKYVSSLIIHIDRQPKLFEVANIKPYHPRIKPPYLFIPNTITKTLPCSQGFRTLDLIVTDAIEMAIKEKCKELSLTIFE